MTIYKSEKGKKEILELYDKQLERLQTAYLNQYVSTSFGETHLVEIGNRSGIPLLLFHGGNETTAYNLLACDFLMEDFHIYAVDTIGHPGKSTEVSLSPRNDDYGKWAGEVISALGYENIRCFGGSFGAGIICKTMCVSPEKVKSAVLCVPSGIKNAPAINSMSMMFPMIMYWITHKYFALVDVNQDGNTELVFKICDGPSELLYLLGVYDNELICFDVFETHTTHMAFDVYDNGNSYWGQNYDGNETVYYTYTSEGTAHELIHFVSESAEDYAADYYFLEGDETTKHSIAGEKEYLELESSYRGKTLEWYDCESFIDIPKK